jgi:hypothetical protein
MQSMCGVCARIGLLFPLYLLAGFLPSANGDLIRAAPGRTFPDIAGDVGGSQTYVYDPATQTGTFALVNAPHLISLGPSVKDLIPLQPDRQGTLYQALRLKLDRSGRLIDSPLNKFEIRGTVIINDQIYEGVLLAGKPTAFGIAEPDRPVRKDLEVFGLNVQIKSGALADAFGSEAYLRIIPQANSTFRGEFTRDFSGERPLTNLIALDQRLAPVPALGTAGLLAIVAGAIGLVLWRIIRWVARNGRRCALPRHRPVRRYATPSL